MAGRPKKRGGAAEWPVASQVSGEMPGPPLGGCGWKSPPVSQYREFPTSARRHTIRNASDVIWAKGKCMAMRNLVTRVMCDRQSAMKNESFPGRRGGNHWGSRWMKDRRKTAGHSIGGWPWPQKCDDLWATIAQSHGRDSSCAAMARDRIPDSST